MELSCQRSEREFLSSVTVFPNVPPAPGMPCQGEDSECIYCSLETLQQPQRPAYTYLY